MDNKCYYLQGYILHENGKEPEVLLSEIKMKGKIRHCGIIRGQVFVPYYMINSQNREYLETKMLESNHTASVASFELSKKEYDKVQRNYPEIFIRV